MHTTDLIKAALDVIFSFYKKTPQPAFNTAVKYILFWALATFIVVIPIFGLMALIGIGIDTYAYTPSIFYNELYINRFYQYAAAFYLMSMAFFGIFLSENKPSNSIFSFRNVFASLDAKHWIVWIGILGTILLFFTLSFDFKIERHRIDSDLLGYFPARESWYDSMLNLFKLYLPGFGAMLFLMFYYSGRLNKEMLMRYKNAFFASLILTFVWETIFQAVLGLFKVYVGGLLYEIPFFDKVFPTALTVIFDIAFLSYAFPAVAIGFTYPFKRVSEQIPFEVPPL